MSMGFITCEFLARAWYRSWSLATSSWIPHLSIELCFSWILQELQDSRLHVPHSWNSHVSMDGAFACGSWRSFRSQNHYIYRWIPPDLSMELCLQILHEEIQDPRLHTWTLNPRTQFIPQHAGALQLVDFALGVSGLTSMITCPNSQTEYLPAAFELWNPKVETLVNLDSALHHGSSSSPEFKSIFIMLSRTLMKLPGSNQKIFPIPNWSHLVSDILIFFQDMGRSSFHTPK